MKITLKRLMPPFLLLVLLCMTGCGNAEISNVDIDMLVENLHEATVDHIIWEPEVLEMEDAYISYNPRYTLPEDGDLSQDDALRTAINTVLLLTDRSASDIYNTYQIRFHFNIEPRGTQRYWTVLFYLGEEKMGGKSYLVEVWSADGVLKRFEDITS